MYLSKMSLNRRRRGAVKLLSSPQAMHAAVQSAFAPGSFAESDGRALWRVDELGRDDIALYVVSPVEPDLSHVVEQAGWQTGEMWKTVEYGGFLAGLQAGQRWGFRLRANPVHNVYKTDKAWGDTKPVAHLTVKHQQTWLLDRAAKSGFSIPDGPQHEAALQVIDRSTLKFNKGGHSVTIGTATFEGVLQVEDPVLLRSVLTNGLGRAKAYGCGLITLAPLGIG
ncbi:type I-E CRISPR-associated protein Cas6/Cse3/CasE [Rhodococcoides yunnanense]|jgi:CRISPR system Cascade subunit CasE|uniref:type I-E CRISPR-associated protein Cas6/Cse3/CasE n=1 Tax=Rhodococcoides yunnanense TaxID=278209 RepID=UPI0022B11E92|nr:type I-E CRISPR-associated protein Cas6/Cse3/CasE [Rhodococcus yunnanensis]MCZ4276505.1 type I-E CRISPR-associated protein Cas6/Cse3/CasE [Rhodococcus yunnanensis]